METLVAKDGERARTYWNRHAADYDRSMRILGGPLPRMVELVGEAARGAERVLEVAAGTGLVTPALAAAAKEVTATDYAEEMVARLETRVRELGLANVRCEQADIYGLRFEPGSFDLVVAANVLHLLPDLPGALAALRRVLKPGGRLVVPTFLHEENLLARMGSRILAWTGFPGQRRFSSASLGATLDEAGFRVIRSEVIPGLIPIGFANCVPR